MTGPRLGVHASLRPAHSLTPLELGFVGGHRRRDFPCRRHSSDVASNYCRSGSLTLRGHEFLQASPNYADTGGADFEAITQAIGTGSAGRSSAVMFWNPLSDSSATSSEAVS